MAVPAPPDPSWFIFRNDPDGRNVLPFDHCGQFHNLPDYQGRLDTSPGGLGLSVGAASQGAPANLLIDLDQNGPLFSIMVVILP